MTHRCTGECGDMEEGVGLEVRHESGGGSRGSTE